MKTLNNFMKNNNGYDSVLKNVSISDYGYVSCQFEFFTVLLYTI